MGENSNSFALQETITSLLNKSNLSAEDIDLILLSPCGNSQDKKLLEVKQNLFATTPVYTANFNTGFVETSAMSLTICTCLQTLAENKPLKMKPCKNDLLDKIPLPQNPKKILAFTSSHVGNNTAILIER